MQISSPLKKINQTLSELHLKTHNQNAALTQATPDSQTVWDQETKELIVRPTIEIRLKPTMERNHFKYV